VGGWVGEWIGSYSFSIRAAPLLSLRPPVAMRQPEAAADLKDEDRINRLLNYVWFCGIGSQVVLSTALIPHLIHIYFRLECDLLSNHPSSSLHVSAVYGHHQVSLAKIVALYVELRIACERDFSWLK
jgi:hypothetical protein